VAAEGEGRPGEAPDVPSPDRPAPATDPVIRVENLHKSFGRREVLRGFSLDVPRREFVAVVGGSGSGKSVLLRHLAGLLHPDRGRILLEGVDIVRADRKQLADLHRKIGFLFQEGGLLNSLSLYDNIALPLRERGELTEDEIRSRALERLDRVGISEAATKTPSELSGGMRKRAGLARALIEDRSFLFLDEPTSALDPMTAASIRELIGEVHRQGGATTIAVTHDLALAKSVADRVVFLRDGRVRREGTYDQLAESDDRVVRDFFEAGRV
jgi:phospholipid/cholesterol/gamma-HCH transport system ATP-binding protein